MINGIFHTNYTPVHVLGTAAEKENYQLKEVKNKRVEPFGGNTELHRENYTMVKCRNGLEYEFYIPGMIHPGAGTAIQVIPFETDNGDGDWPSLTYDILGSLDGVHWVALPTAITALAITSAAGAVHQLLLPFTMYKVYVQGASNNGWFAVISN